MSAERDLLEKYMVAKYMVAKRNTELAKQSFDTHKKALEFIQNQLIEYMNDADVESTAKYVGVGHVTLAKPRLFASYRKEDSAAVYDFVRAHGLGDMIQDSINASTLSSAVSGLMDSGVTVPDCINVYLKPQLRAYKNGGE